jgi:DoxX-like family
MHRIPQRIGSVLITLGGLLLLGSAAAKLAHVLKVVAELGVMGFGGHKLTFVALLEVASAVLFLVPFTRSVGLVLVSAFMGGVIATHLQHEPFHSIFGPSLLLGLLWLGTVLRHREVLWGAQSFTGAPAREPIMRETR